MNNTVLIDFIYLTAAFIFGTFWGGAGKSARPKEFIDPAIVCWCRHYKNFHHEGLGRCGSSSALSFCDCKQFISKEPKV